LSGDNIKSIAGTLAAPFPYFGGKANACELVWASPNCLHKKNEQGGLFDNPDTVRDAYEQTDFLASAQGYGA